MKKTLFLNPPSFEGYDGGAGARYQARREVRSFWYPTWLAHPAAMVPGSLARARLPGPLRESIWAQVDRAPRRRLAGARQKRS